MRILDELVWLSHEIGKEERQLVILGEGNTSAYNGDGTFWVKASGHSLPTIGAEGFSLVNLETILAYLDGPVLDDQGVADALAGSLVEPGYPKPSVETFLHALCMKECGAKFIAHSHAVSVNQILCSIRGAEPFKGNICPDQIVVCGSAPAVVPYVDPGFHLALAVRDEFRRYIAVYGRSPKVLLMENHGIVSLGSTAKEAFNIQLMADKWAKILIGATTMGGIEYLSEENVERISNRLDEKYRQRILEK
ncbi:MAG: class II aldolase [Anaerolineae bacterium]|jgi:rhamnose utilization protein RhaD (predicted bifunctional aldolase and dehydrogenase)|nr:class II aldolase [Anaerolineae bacterium]